MWRLAKSRESIYSLWLYVFTRRVHSLRSIVWRSIKSCHAFSEEAMAHFKMKCIKWKNKGSLTYLEAVSLPKNPMSMKMEDFWNIVICSSFVLARIIIRWIIKVCPCLSLWVSLWMGTTWAFLTILGRGATWGKQIWLSQHVLRGSCNAEETRYNCRKIWHFWHAVWVTDNVKFVQTHFHLQCFNHFA